MVVVCRMANLLVTLAALCLISNTASNPNVPELLPYNPVADPATVVSTTSARFTVFSPSLIRMEYDPAGKFEDRATLAIVNRRVSPVVFNTTYSNGGSTLVITTNALQLQYKVRQCQIIMSLWKY